MDAAASAPRVVVVSASDSRFMPFLRGMLASLEAVAMPVQLACFDLGLDDADRGWLASRGVLVLPPRPHLGVSAAEHGPALLSFLARPFLRSYFPGFDVYVWIDSDVWLQDPDVLRRYVEGAARRGMAVAHEREAGYRFQAWLLGWTAKHMLLGYGPLDALHLLRRPHLNAGFFAVHAEAPHWAAWEARYRAAIERTGALVPHDQFALNQAVHGGWRGGGVTDTALLDPGCNWICDRGIPMWNDAAGVFCKPYAPFEPIGALHLAGPAKRTVYEIARTAGGSFRTCIVQGASPDSAVTVPVLDAVALAVAA